MGSSVSRIVVFPRAASGKMQIVCCTTVLGDFVEFGEICLNERSDEDGRDQIVDLDCQD